MGNSGLLYPLELLVRHVTGDWRDLDEEDKEENKLSVEKGFRILSAYKLATGAKVWIITESNRSATTFLLLEENWRKALFSGKLNKYLSAANFLFKILQSIACYHINLQKG